MSTTYDPDAKLDLDGVRYKVEGMEYHSKRATRMLDELEFMHRQLGEMIDKIARDVYQLHSDIEDIEEGLEDRGE